MNLSVLSDHFHWKKAICDLKQIFVSVDFDQILINVCIGSIVAGSNTYKIYVFSWHYLSNNIYIVSLNEFQIERDVRLA